MLKHRRIAARLDPERDDFQKDPFHIVPRPPTLRIPLQDDASKIGAASFDLRLGTWFLAMRQTTTPLLEVPKPSKGSSTKAGEGRLARRYHIRFGEDFILHPRNFVLGVTLEWLRFPSNLGGYVTGRSSWGRRGLVIATATGVHPGFTGCLTLELANLGDIPIAIRPGMTIGQLFVHPVEADRDDLTVDQSSFVCKRAPRLGDPQSDEIAQKLAFASLEND
jgi:dCTP deaminase